MSEDVGVKAPVTRLRRRLSVETDEVKSPAGTTTPTKKKGGRLATKPQLDLIQENDVEQVPKRSARKTTAKEIVEPVDDKPMTPSRRSARIRSNTSLVSESNQILDSPRAKRAAARRTSQAGSDNDAPVTPARQTRRTRKDSTSSIDKQGDQSSNKTSATPEVIVEEQETNNEPSSEKDKSLSKSPQAKGRKGKKNSLTPSANESENEKIKTKEDKQKDNDEFSENKTTSTDNEQKEIFSKTENNSTKMNFSATINEFLDEKPKKRTSVLHKSTSSIEDSKSFKSKRHRTKSGSTLTENISNECNFFSDNEIYKKKSRDKLLSPHSDSKSLFSDKDIKKIQYDNTLKQINNTDKEKEDTQYASKNNSQTNKVILSNEASRSESSSENMDHNNKSTIDNQLSDNSMTKAGWKKNIINQIENMIDSSTKNNLLSPTKCFEKEPSKNIQSVIIIDDDSNSNAAANGGINQSALHQDSEDQCVPVVKHSINDDNNEQVPCDRSFEPMDIDESIQQSTSLNKSVKNSPKLDNQPETQKQFNNNSVNSNSKKSNRKSSPLSLESLNLDKSSGENKSTLILSVIKDTSNNEICEKSPKTVKKDQLSKSINVLDKTANKEVEKRKLSLDYSTSTPLQQKSMKKLGVPMDTSLISPKPKQKSKLNNNKEECSEEIEESNSEKENELSKEESSMDSKDKLKESDDSGEEVTKTQNEFLDDEAEEAGEDYQSGDSQDEDEKQYEEENKIVEKGETLESDEDFSDDSDYEKDSFVVSSDDEDNELLSGSGDDLSMSDKELSMSAKSKKKYNERKTKEQKKASKEMYEARHKLDNNNKNVKNTKSKKNNRQRLDSSLSESEEEVTVQTKKNNRQRINSSQDLSDVKLDENESAKKKKKRNRLSESVCSESGLNEKEITVNNESRIEIENPISVAIKQEPKTPQKSNNLSAVVINENIEEVNIDSNASIIKPNETSDPLQATMFDTDEDSESSEEHQEIVKVYNSLLEDLNTNSAKNKMHDISLNINKKQKKSNEPIVDQLNLTQTKEKKIKNKLAEQGTSSTRILEETNKFSDKEDEESDSIDMRLLFTEDSNDSVSNTERSNKEVDVNTEDRKEFIPLKKTEAKTNLLEDMESSTDVDIWSKQNDTKKKNKTRKSSQHISEELSSLDNGNNCEDSFFIDTMGAHFDTDKSIDTSKNSSKKKKKRSSVSDANNLECDEVLIIHDQNATKGTPKKPLNLTENQIDDEFITIDTEDTNAPTNTPQSSKKKKKGKTSLSITVEEDEIVDTVHVEDKFFIDTVGTRNDADEQTNSSKKKKKRNSICINDMLELTVDNDSNVVTKTPRKSLNNTESMDVEINYTDEAANESTNTLGSTKKNKKSKKSITNTAEEQETQNDDIEIPEITTVPVKTPQSGKKKNKSLLLDESISQVHSELTIENKTPQSVKKKNKSLLLDGSENKSPIQVQEELPIPTKTPQSGKKKNKSLLVEDSEGEKLQTSFVVNPNSDKKKKAKKSLTGQNESILADDISEPVEVVYQSEKERKSSLSKVDTPSVIQSESNKSDEEDGPLEISYRSNNKNKSILESQELENKVATDVSLNTSSNSTKKQKQKSLMKSSKSEKCTTEDNEVNVFPNNQEDGTKNRKRKHSATIEEYIPLGDDGEKKKMTEKLNESSSGRQKKKRKLISETDEVVEKNEEPTKKDTKVISNVEMLEHKKIKNKHVLKRQNTQTVEQETAVVNQNKKRKQRDDDVEKNISKIFKQDSLNKAQVPRLPSHILNQLEDKPNKNSAGEKKKKVIATTEFKVEETRIKRNKPSSYLEESVYLNDDSIVEKNTKKHSIKKPKVLPFMPTASTSDSGFTTNFKINLLPRETKFIAQSANVINFKNDFLQQQKIKKFRTFEKYKTQRNVKLSKF